MAVKKVATKKKVGNRTNYKALAEFRASQLTETNRELGQFETQALALRALSEIYALDTTAPGMVVAFIPDKQKFYASICRYDGPGHGEGKTRILHAFAATLGDAVESLARQWHGKTVAVNAFRAACNERFEDQLEDRL